MRAGQRERRCVVIEGRRSPSRRIVTRGAGRGESGSDVIGIRGSCVIGLVARVAICRHGCVVVVGVTRRAGNCGVRAGQWE